VAAAKADDQEFAARSYARVGLLGGLAICIVVATALVAQIVLLRRDRVRAASDAAAAAAAN
jgi:hypothetical protein